MATNMNEVVNVASHLAGKDPWVWVLAMFIVSLGGMVIAVRYTVKRFETLLSELNKVQDARLQSATDLHKQKEDQAREHAHRLEKLLEENAVAKHDLANALNQLSHEFTRFRSILSECPGLSGKGVA